MRKRVFGYNLNRDRNERQALFRSLLSALIEKEGIETTAVKAKAIRGTAEKLITKAKRGTLNDRRIVKKTLLKTPLVNKLFDQIAPVFKNRNGGYLRIVKLGRRYGDDAPLVKLLFTEDIPVFVKVVKEQNLKTETMPVVEKEIKEEKPVKKTIKKAIKND